ncbi:hypothetical protein PCASD_04396 [Puccinia coronata f. sp. avenae]|uniref:Uncharacterized protein n=1 Tax=Puccinia coronata f. sp. avenae TaxID=200324 RepID=A0A2N5VBS2_9BASI|nr:hypothetical protein PCASD_04396 [Puccinia coronata f. sp. avenae]
MVQQSYNGGTNRLVGHQDGGRATPPGQTAVRPTSSGSVGLTRSDQWNWLGDRRWTSVMRSLPKRAPLHDGWTDRHPAITQRSSTSNPRQSAVGNIAHGGPTSVLPTDGTQREKQNGQWLEPSIFWYSPPLSRRESGMEKLVSKKKKTASPPLIQRSTLWLDGGPTKQSGPPLEICRNIVATVPTVEPGSFQRSCDPTVKPPEQIPTPTPPPQLTKVELTCSLWFENPFASPPAASPLAFASKETLYVIADAADPLRMELAEGVMKFGAFTNSWTAEARSGNKHDAFIAAAHAFPAASQFEVLVKMDKPEEEIVILQGLRPPALTIVPEVATIVTPGTHQPTTPRATPHQPADSQLANNQVLNNQPAKDQLADNHPADNQPAKLPTPDLTLEQFFNICKIDFTNRQI